MTLKLLDKRDIQAKKAKERSQEVAEGVKLARRIDALRETQAEEQSSLESFRVRTIETINKEIKALADTRDLLSGEVKNLEDRKKEALKPIDAELKKLEKEREEVNSKKIEIASSLKDIQEQTKILNKREKQIKRTEEITADLHLQSESLFNERNQRLSHAKEIEQEMALSQERHNSRLVSLEKEVVDKLSQAELTLSKARATLKKASEKEKELSEKEVLLIDREQTLERSIIRLKEGRI